MLEKQEFRPEYRTAYNLIMAFPFRSAQEGEGDLMSPLAFLTMIFGGGAGIADLSRSDDNASPVAALPPLITPVFAAARTRQQYTSLLCMLLTAGALK